LTSLLSASLSFSHRSVAWSPAHTWHAADANNPPRAYVHTPLSLSLSLQLPSSSLTLCVYGLRSNGHSIRLFPLWTLSLLSLLPSNFPPTMSNQPSGAVVEQHEEVSGRSIFRPFLSSSLPLLSIAPFLPLSKSHVHLHCNSRMNGQAQGQGGRKETKSRARGPVSLPDCCLGHLPPLSPHHPPLHKLYLMMRFSPVPFTFSSSIRRQTPAPLTTPPQGHATFAPIPLIGSSSLTQPRDPPANVALPRITPTLAYAALIA
jgi:hypothetical protein